MFVSLLGPLFIPRAFRWWVPLNEWLLASGPIGFRLNVLGLIPRGHLLDSFAWMVGLQTAAGTLLAIGAGFALRPSYRAWPSRVYDDSGVGRRGGPRAALLWR